MWSIWILTTIHMVWSTYVYDPRYLAPTQIDRILFAHSHVDICIYVGTKCSLNIICRYICRYSRTHECTHVWTHWIMMLLIVRMTHGTKVHNTKNWAKLGTYLHSCVKEYFCQLSNPVIMKKLWLRTNFPNTNPVRSYYQMNA